MMSDLRKILNKIPEENTKEFIKWKKEVQKVNTIPNHLDMISILLRGPEDDRNAALMALNIMGVPAEKSTSPDLKTIYKVKPPGQEEWNSFFPK